MKNRPCKLPKIVLLTDHSKLLNFTLIVY